MVSFRTRKCKSWHSDSRVRLTCSRIAWKICLYDLNSNRNCSFGLSPCGNDGKNLNQAHTLKDRQPNSHSHCRQG